MKKRTEMNAKKKKGKKEYPFVYYARYAYAARRYGPDQSETFLTSPSRDSSAAYAPPGASVLPQQH